MGFAVRPMRMDDIPQVQEIDKEAFPTSWPPTSFRRELQNHLARYLVAWELKPNEDPLESLVYPGGMPAGTPPHELAPLRWLRGLRDMVLGEPRLPVSTREPNLVGFAGLWFMVDEAHLVSIATRGSYRGKGIGELVLIGALELSLQKQCRYMTLEVRVSNTGAQALYDKYGFNRMGVRKGYYSDNNEDAYIMNTPGFSEDSYMSTFQQLKEAHRQKWGESVRLLG